MIKIPEAARRLKQVHPDVRITKVAFFDPEYYLFVAPATDEGPDYDDPFYLVGIEKGDVHTFAPTEYPEYLDALKDALDKRSVDLGKAGLK